MRNKVMILLLLLSSSATVTWAAQDLDVSKICSEANSAAIKKVHLNFVPSYFAKVYATKDYLTFISDGQNYILNLDDGSFTKVNGTYDPVPTPDEKFLTSIKSGENLFWFNTKDIEDTWNSSDYPRSYKAENFDLNYAYQSVGALGYKSSQQTRNYRLLTDDDKGDIYYKDVHFQYASANDPTPTKTEDNWVRFCGNVNATFKLPMISKDGKQASVYNTTLGKTQIYSINAQGGCKLQQTLPYATGKADFSFAGNKVVFHMGRYTEPKEWFKYDNPQYHLNVYVWDLDKKKLTQVTDTADGNSYFPTFRKNGTVGYLQAHHGADGDSYYYVLADPEKGKKLEADDALDETCDCHIQKFAATVGIGAIRDSICGGLSGGASMENVAASAISLSKDQCETMLKQLWKKKVATSTSDIVTTMSSTKDSETEKVARVLKELPLSAMLAACPHSQASSAAGVTESAVLKQASNPHDMLVTSCSECHSGSSASSGHPFDLKNVAGIPLSTRQKMAERVLKGEMPPGGLPDQAQRKKISDYLLSPQQ